MGLFNDVSSGLEGLVRRGNVGGLFLNVAHGLSDSAAKVLHWNIDAFATQSSDYKYIYKTSVGVLERSYGCILPQTIKEMNWKHRPKPSFHLIVNVLNITM